jgi:hypothetical protein
VVSKRSVRQITGREQIRVRLTTDPSGWRVPATAPNPGAWRGGRYGTVIAWIHRNGSAVEPKLGGKSTPWRQRFRRPVAAWQGLSIDLNSWPRPFRGARIGVESSPTQVDASRSCRLRRRAARATGGSPPSKRCTSPSTGAEGEPRPISVDCGVGPVPTPQLMGTPADRRHTLYEPGTTRDYPHPIYRNWLQCLS